MGINGDTVLMPRKWVSLSDVVQKVYEETVNGPSISRTRFLQAVNRLEVMRNVKNAPDKLVVRMTTKYKRWSLYDELDKTSVRFMDHGPVK
jgi:hypothetical protein